MIVEVLPFNDRTGNIGANSPRKAKVLGRQSTAGPECYIHHRLWTAW
jgi:hypothetical protein